MAKILKVLLHADKVICPRGRLALVFQNWHVVLQTCNLDFMPIIIMEFTVHIYIEYGYVSQRKCSNDCFACN